jgi:hypothetical protein
VVIRGAGASSTVVLAKARSRHFTASSPGNLTITGLALINGFRTGTSQMEGGSVLVSSVGAVCRPYGALAHTYEQ